MKLNSAEAVAEIGKCGYRARLIVMTHGPRYSIVLEDGAGRKFEAPPYDDEEVAWAVAVDLAHMLK